MAAQILSIVVLLVVFLIGTLRPVNLGALGLVATFGVGLLLTHEDFDKLISGFPVDALILLVGVTYLFGIATVNGTVQWLVTAVSRLARGNRVLIPWLLFLVTAVICNAGAAGPVGAALVAPIGLRLAERYRISTRLAAVMVTNGANSGNLSPLNVLGIVVNSGVERYHLGVNPTWLWLGNFGFTVLLGALAFCVFGGLQLIREHRTRTAEPATVGGAADGPAGDGSADTATTPPAADDTAAHPGPLTLTLTLVFLVAVAGGALVFGLDIGMLAIIAAVVLNLLLPRSSSGGLSKISWNTVLLIGGIVTYVELLQRMGTVKMIGDSVAAISVALLAALLLIFIAGLTSAFASSLGILGAMIPLAVPFLSGGSLAASGVVLAIAISATAVDSTPFSSMGAITVASAPEEKRDWLYRGMVRWGFSMIIVAPLTTWLVFVLI